MTSRNEKANASRLGFTAVCVFVCVCVCGLAVAPKATLQYLLFP